jgi:hypothetical protein
MAPSQQEELGGERLFERLEERVIVLGGAATGSTLIGRQRAHSLDSLVHGGDCTSSNLSR